MLARGEEIALNRSLSPEESEAVNLPPDFSCQSQQIRRGNPSKVTFDSSEAPASACVECYPNALSCGTSRLPANVIPGLPVRSGRTAARAELIIIAAAITVVSHHPQRWHLRRRTPQTNRDYRANQNAITTHNISRGGLFTCATTAAAAKSRRRSEPQCQALTCGIQRNRRSALWKSLFLSQTAEIPC